MPAGTVKAIPEHTVTVFVDNKLVNPPLNKVYAFTKADYDALIAAGAKLRKPENEDPEALEDEVAAEELNPDTSGQTTGTISGQTADGKQMETAPTLTAAQRRAAANKQRDDAAGL